MRKTFSLLFILLPMLGFGSTTLSGSWVEVKRWSMHGPQVDYTDSIILQFRNNQYVMQRTGVGFIWDGQYTLHGQTLDLVKNIYQVQDFSSNYMVLKDDNYIHEFAPYFAPQQNYLPPQPPPHAVTDAGMLVGEWLVFNALSDKTLPYVDYYRRIKKIVITDDGREKNGLIFGSRDGDEPSWFVEDYNNQVLYCDGNDKRELTVVKCEDNELIVDCEGIRYFLRQFNDNNNYSATPSYGMTYDKRGYNNGGYDAPTAYSANQYDASRTMVTRSEMREHNTGRYSSEYSSREYHSWQNAPAQYDNRDRQYDNRNYNNRSHSNWQQNDRRYDNRRYDDRNDNNQYDNIQYNNRPNGY